MNDTALHELKNRALCASDLDAAFCRGVARLYKHYMGLRFAQYLAVLQSHRYKCCTGKVTHKSVGDAVKGKHIRVDNAEVKALSSKAFADMVQGDVALVLFIGKKAVAMPTPHTVEAERYTGIF